MCPDSRLLRESNVLASTRLETWIFNFVYENCGNSRQSFANSFGASKARIGAEIYIYPVLCLKLLTEQNFDRFNVWALWKLLKRNFDWGTDFTFLLVFKLFDSTLFKQNYRSSKRIEGGVTVMFCCLRDSRCYASPM